MQRPSPSLTGGSGRGPGPGDPQPRAHLFRAARDHPAFRCGRRSVGQRCRYGLEGRLPARVQGWDLGLEGEDPGHLLWQPGPWDWALDLDPVPDWLWASVTSTLSPGSHLLSGVMVPGLQDFCGVRLMFTLAPILLPPAPSLPPTVKAGNACGSPAPPSYSPPTPSGGAGAEAELHWGAGACEQHQEEGKKVGGLPHFSGDLGI